MTEEQAIKKGITLVAVAVLGTFGGFKFFEKIDNGYVGVRYSMNGGVKDETLSQGVKFVGFDKVTQYPIRLQTINAKNISISTKDGKKTKVDIKYDYKVDSTQASKMYKEFGNIKSEDIEKGWVKSKLQKEAREVYARYNLLNILSGDSSKIEAELLEDFAKSVEKKGFIVEDITVDVPEVDPDTQKSIDGIIQAGQKNEKAKLDAETKKTTADGEAYKKIKEAEAEEASNRKVSESITDNLIKWEEAKGKAKYGELRTIVGENGSVIVDGK